MRTLRHAVNGGGVGRRRWKRRAEGRAGAAGRGHVGVVGSEGGSWRFRLLLLRRDGSRALCSRATPRSASRFKSEGCFGQVCKMHISNNRLYSPALRARRSCLPFSISSSSFRYRSLSSRSRFSESSRTDLRKAAGSKSVSSCGASSEVFLFRKGANGDACELLRSGEAEVCRGGEIASTTEDAIITTTQTQQQHDWDGQSVDRDPRPRVHERAAVRVGRGNCGRQPYVQLGGNGIIVVERSVSDACYLDHRPHISSRCGNVTPHRLLHRWNAASSTRPSL